MATKKCANGHRYDASIYGDQCPYCPKPDATITMPRTEATRRIETGTVPMTERTVQMTEQTVPLKDETMPIKEEQAVINDPQGRKMIGLLVSYDTNPSGEVYKVYEGRNEISFGGKKFSFFYIPQ